MSHLSFALTRRKLGSLFLAGACLLIPLPAQADGGEPAAEAYVTAVARDVMQLSGDAGSDKLRSRVHALLERQADVRTIALFSLGPYRKDLPPDQRDIYFSLVQDYAAGMIAAYIRDFSGADFRIRSSSRSGRFILVDSEIDYPGGRQSQIIWRVLQSGGGLRVADVSVRGIWLSLQMRTSFTQVLDRSRGDFSQLISYLKRG